MKAVAIVSVSDGRERVHQGLLPVITAHVERLANFLLASNWVNVVVAQTIHTPEEAQALAAQLRAQGAQLLICCQPVFGFPHNAVSLIRDLGLPTLLYAPWEPAYPALVGVLTIGGGLTQMGLAHRRLWGSLDDTETQRQILAFVRGAGAASALHGRVVGQLGGRSMGLYTTAADGALWQRIFGVDLDHADQIEIVRRGNIIAEERAQAGMQWLQRYSQVQFDGQQLTEAKLLQQVRAYLATKEIARDLAWDAVALKCHYEMSEFQVAQCLTTALMNDAHDWEGDKPIIPTSCEADADGALTMLALHLMTGEPAALLDVRFFDRDKDVYVLSNCGAAPTSFAGTAGTSWEEALRRVVFCPCTSKYLSGGAQIRMVFAEGEMTLARLTRDPQGYRMLIARGEALALPLEEVEGTNPIWPHAFVHLALRPQELVEMLEANHVHLVHGDWRQELREFCHTTGIRIVEVE
mgnify:CR=1 FL=1